LVTGAIANSLIALRGTDVAPFTVVRVATGTELHMRNRILAAAAATVSMVATLTLVAPAIALAQSDQAGIQEPVTLSDAELRSFAAAALGVKRVADSYLPILAEMQSFEEKSRVESAAYSEIKQIVENEGITVSRFNEILTLASASPDLADRIRSHMHPPR